MKRFLAILITLCLIVGSTIIASAETEDDVVTMDNYVSTAETTVSMTVDSTADTYIITIPASVSIDPKTQYGYGTITLKAGWDLISVNSLSVRLSDAANGIDTGYMHAGVDSRNTEIPITGECWQNFRLCDENGNSCTYAIKASTLPQPFSGNSQIKDTADIDTRHFDGGRYYKTTKIIKAIKGGDNTKDTVSELEFYVRDMPEAGAGVYSDTLTFSVITE